ncbi:uncharacterized protein PG986_012697 [Apiospora aurea]|uniref:Uncharacterized protein n=1 Tax=Apiospora aurea TaxID=335848 RepID=A0ABR1Q166_9PEZI
MPQPGQGGMAGAAKTPATAGIGEDKPKAFDAQGAIGKQFTGMFAQPLLIPRAFHEARILILPLLHEDKGAIGGTAAAIGGPLAKDGMIGKQFTTEGGIGGNVQNAMGGTKGPGSN